MSKWQTCLAVMDNELWITISDCVWISELNSLSLSQGKFSKYTNLVTAKRRNRQFACVFPTEARQCNATFIYK